MGGKFVIGVVLAVLLVGVVGGWIARDLIHPPVTHVVIDEPSSGGWGTAAGPTVACILNHTPCP